MTAASRWRIAERRDEGVEVMRSMWCESTSDTIREIVAFL
jgi:hypothetical protein